MAFFFVQAIFIILMPPSPFIYLFDGYVIILICLSMI